MTYIYAGPSWAHSSYPINKTATNLAKEWNFPYIDATEQSTSVLNRINYIKKKLNLTDPIIWIYNEPFLDLTAITNMSMQELLQRADWEDIWHECNQYCLSAIASLKVPVLLIGAHSDIVNCNHSNITVACDSWQKWLAKQVHMPVVDGIISVIMDDGGDFTLDRAWGAEIIHKIMHEHPDIDPDKSLVNSIWDIFFFWQQLEKANIFYETHPNLLGNQLFAKFLLPTVTKFLQENQ